MNQSKISGGVSNNEESLKVLNVSKTLESKLNSGINDAMNQSKLSTQTKNSSNTLRKAAEAKAK
jgi:hypothetical protein